MTESEFWSNVNKTETCWLWLGPPNSAGYGSVNFGGRVRGAHVVAFVLTKNDSVSGYDVHHTCENKMCVNPEHLERKLRIEHPGTANFIAAHKTHCNHGHEFTPENTMWLSYRGRSKKYRRCLTCYKIANKGKKVSLLK
jgi:hypothetical protein